MPADVLFWPFPSYPLPLFQNESTCETIHMKMCCNSTAIFMKIARRLVLNLRQLGNGLFVVLIHHGHPMDNDVVANQHFLLYLFF